MPTASTNFSSGTVVTSTWLNAIDALAFDEVVNASSYGAVGNGIVDDTAALLEAFTVALTTNKPIVLKGNYRVTGPITAGGTSGSPPYTYNNSLNIHCLGDVTITVDSSSVAFQRLITVYSTVPISSTTTGGVLSINLNNKCACGIYLRHDAATSSGVISWGPVQVSNTFDTNATAVMEAAAIQIDGRFINVNLESPIVSGVNRTDTAGFCKGISISEIDGPVVINNPLISNVICTGGTKDADGISVFGRTITTAYGTRGGSLTILNANINDCQGRSIKTQITKSSIINATINRKLIQAFVTADIDHQVGGHHVIDGATFNYLRNGGTPPFTAGFYPVSFQQRCIDAPGQMVLTNSIVKTESTVPYVVYITVGSTVVDGFTADALSNISIVENVIVEGQGVLKNLVCLTRCFMEFQAERVRTNTNNTYFDIKFNTMNIAGLELVGYTNSTSATVNNLFASAVSNVNIGSGAGVARIASLSGTTITSFGVDRGVSNSNIT